MAQKGPQLDRLLHRLADCPPDFLLAPDQLDLTALVCDHCRALGVGIPSPHERRFLAALASEPQRLMLVVLWLLHDDWFLDRPELAHATRRFLQSGSLVKLAKLVPADAIVNDPDRREELVRLCLKGLGLEPEGESTAQADDRLNTLDSVERERVVRQTREAEARAEKSVRQWPVREPKRLPPDIHANETQHVGYASHRSRPFPAANRPQPSDVAPVATTCARSAVDLSMWRSP